MTAEMASESTRRNARRFGSRVMSFVGPHLTHTGYQPSEAHSEIRDMLRRPLSAR